MILNIPYQSVQWMAEVKTLVDSGATKNLVNKEVAEELGITLQELPLAWNITNVDRTGNVNGPITHFCELRICQKMSKNSMSPTWVTTKQS